MSLFISLFFSPQFHGLPPVSRKCARCPFFFSFLPKQSHIFILNWRLTIVYKSKRIKGLWNCLQNNFLLLVISWQNPIKVVMGESKLSAIAHFYNGLEISGFQLQMSLSKKRSKCEGRNKISANVEAFRIRVGGSFKSSVCHWNSGRSLPYTRWPTLEQGEWTKISKFLSKVIGFPFCLKFTLSGGCVFVPQTCFMIKR